MKKARILTVIAVLIVLSVGCSQIDETGGIISDTPLTSFFSAGKTEEPTLPDEETATTTKSETTITESGQETPTVSDAITPSTSDTVSQGQSSTQKTDDNKPTQSKPPAEPSKPTDPPPKQTDPPAETTPTPVFNPQTYYDHAMTYAKSIGLKFYPDMNIEENAWNAPQNLYDTLSDNTMKLNIESQCNRLKREGFEYFGLYLEKQPNGTSYKLYIMYG